MRVSNLRDETIWNEKAFLDVLQRISIFGTYFEPS